MRNQLKKVFAVLLAAGVLSTSAGITVLAEEPVADNTQAEAAVEETDALPESGDSAIEEKNEAAAPEADTENAADKMAQEDTLTKAEEEVTTFSMDAALFDDINSGDWFHSYVSWAFSKGIMTGKGDNKFAPSETLSRAQFATVLYRMSGSPEVGYNAKFPDVPEGTFYSNAVSWATQDDVQVITGYADGNFGAVDAITREQMATMLHRYYAYKSFEAVEAGNLDAFPDVASVSTYAKDAMAWAVGAKIISGDQGNLNPQGQTSRAVCATMMKRFCEKFMPGQLPDIDITASLGRIEAETANAELGTFRVRLYDVQASTGISKVQVQVWCNDPGDDSHWYEAGLQGDGSYAFEGDPVNHKYHTGTYTIRAYTLLKNGVRLPIGEHSMNVSVAEIPARLYRLTNDVYSQVGRDLYACYKRSVMTYYEPYEDVPGGYTPSQFYAIYGMEHSRGNCYIMAATFYHLAKGMGYDAHYVEGSVPLSAGGMGPHGWVEINMDGTTYVFDPDFEAETGRNGYQISYGASGTWRYSNYGWVD